MSDSKNKKGGYLPDVPVLMNVPRARKLMDEDGIDVLMAYSPRNVAYLSGVVVYEWIWDGIQHFLEHNIQAECRPLAGFCKEKPPFIAGWQSAWNRGWIEEISQGGPGMIEPGGSSFPNVFSAVKAIKERGLEKAHIGYEETRLPVYYLEVFKRELPYATWVPAYNLFLEIRAVKTEEEIRTLKKTYGIATKVYQQVFKLMRPGMTLVEVQQTQRHLTYQLGGNWVFNHLWIRGPGDTVPAENPWWIPGPEKILKAGDAGGMDLGVSVNGYMCDYQRSVSIGKAAGEVRKNLDELITVRNAMKERAVIGNTGRDVYQAAIDCVEKHKMEGGAGFIGHGLGIECHELPWIRPDDTTVLEKGMVFVIEMNRALNNHGILLIEDAGVITENGWETLADLPVDLVEIL